MPPLVKPAGIFGESALTDSPWRSVIPLTLLGRPAHAGSTATHPPSALRGPAIWPPQLRPRIPMLPIDDLTRRGFLASATATALLTACSGTPAGTDRTGTAEWRFTDDRGVTVTRPSRPARIVTNDQAGAALASLGVRPIGMFGSAPMAQNPLLEGVDLAGIESIGEVYGEINRTPVPRSGPPPRPNQVCSPPPSTPPPVRGSRFAGPPHSPVCASCSNWASSWWYRRAELSTSTRTSATSFSIP